MFFPGFRLVVLLGLFLLCPGSFVLSAASPDTPLRSVEAEAFFENRIRPVLVDSCLECHGASGPKAPKAGLLMDSRENLLKGGNSGPAIVPGDPARSLLLRVVRHEIRDLEMPSKKPRLPQNVIADLTSWIQSGAVYPSSAPVAAVRPHWAFQPVRMPQPPAIHSPWVRTPIDLFILQSLEGKGMKPGPAADKRSLLRRVSFDLTGLPPSPEEVDAFVADESTEAFARVVDRLLASPHYGERWGRHWLDLVRYADTAGETADYPVPVAWRYRNYVIDAFNADKPYDLFLQEQIAGDILARQGPKELYAERVVATGYLGISRRFGFDSENYHHLTIQDTIDTLGQTVLGLTLGCARCHSHKFDPVSMQDYYALYGIFDSTRYAFPGSEQKQKHRALVPLLPVEESKPRWRAFDEKVAALVVRLEKAKKSATPAVLRSLDDLDGDFEMQAPAAGGSKGVLVPPWVYDGGIAVTREAQSPFKNLYALGRVGAAVPGGTNHYRIAQTLHPRRTASHGARFHVNLDFRIATNGPAATGPHRFWLGDNSTPAVEILLSRSSVGMRLKSGVTELRRIPAGEWCNLQLSVDLKSRTVSAAIGSPGDVVQVKPRPLLSGWTGRLDYIALDSEFSHGVHLAGIEIDNLGVQESPLAAVSTEVPSLVTEKLAPPSPSPEQARQIEAELEKTRQELNDLLAEGPFDLAYAVSEGTPRDARIQMRGEPDRPGDEVPRGFIKVLGGRPLERGSEGSGRLELARWLTSPENPLTARVMVNRIWQLHFGQGLVKTPNDFGTRGAAPTHPELLDYLAGRFIQERWSMKAMHRLILLSSTYQQASMLPESGDAGVERSANYAAFTRRRLSAEEIRDGILQVSGELELRRGRGHPFPKPTGWGYTQHGPFTAVYDHNLRSVYLMTQRIKRHPFLALFDGADPNASTAERRTTTVPTQALFFLNDPFVHDKAGRFGERLAAIQGDDSTRVHAAYRKAFGRIPTRFEQEDALAFLSAYRSELGSAGTKTGEPLAWAAFGRVLFGSNEFLSVD